MMKRVALYSAAAALLIFTGCCTKEPAIDATANNASSASSTSASANGTSGTDSNAVIAPITNANTADAASSVSNGSDSGLVSILFDFDKFNIREDMTQPMQNNSAMLKGKNAIKLEGNCDEFGSDEYNYALGLRRANAVKDSLVAQGVDAAAISMVSFGESNPVCLEKTQECWDKNRRVDFKLP